MHEAYLLIFLFGLAFGSFLNVVILRVRHQESFWHGRSCCPYCKKQLAWYDLIPVLSFVVLRERCRHCKKNISLQYPIVELWMGVVFVAISYLHWRNGVMITAELIRDLVMVTLLTFIFIYDFLFYEIITNAVWASSFILFICSLIFQWRSWREMAVGIAVAGGFFLLQYSLSRGKWIGGGDISLGVFMGVSLGWPLTLIGLFFTYVVGALMSVVLILLKRKKMTDRTPLGTYLAIGMGVALLMGNQLIGFIW